MRGNAAADPGPAAWASPAERLRRLAPAGLPMPWEEVVRLGTELGRALERWHKQKGLHAAVCPDTIIVERGPGNQVHRAYLIGVDAAPVGYVHYAAPEQTARFWRDVDGRTDLYALGVLLFELATAAPPIPAESPAQRTHRQLTAEVVRPATLSPGLPPVLEDIIGQLLAVAPEDRYQTARGAAMDLRRCRDELTVAPGSAGRSPRQFTLGRWDTPDRLVTSGRIYGRRDRLARVTGVYKRVAAGNGAAAVSITGDEGLGKTALLGHVTDGFIRDGGCAARTAAGPGDAPFPTLTRLLDDLADQLLMQADGRPERWRVPLRDALGPAAGTLLTLVPAFGSLLHEAAPAEQGPTAAEHAEQGANARHRLRLAVGRLLAAVADQEGALVLALDDAHRADPASLHLLAEVFHELHDEPLLLLLAYTPREVNESHPVAALLRGLVGDVQAVTVPLRPLPDAALAELLADLLNAELRQATQLARVVAAKVGSNPMVVVEVLRQLHDRRRLVFDTKGGAWQWSAAQVEAASEHAPAAAPQPGLARYGAEVHRLLRAASMSVAVPAGLLPAVTDRSAADVHGRLRDPLRDGLLVPDGSGGYRWAHETIRQQFHATLTDEETALVRAAIVRAVLDDPAVVPELAITQLAGADPYIAGDRRARVAELRLAAGRRAYRVGAITAARDHLGAAVDSLAPDAWAHRPELAYAVHFAAAEAMRDAGAGEAAESMTELAARYAADDLDRVRLWALRTRWRRIDGDRAAAFAAAAEALGMLGITVPRDQPGIDAALAGAVASLRPRLGDGAVDTMVDAEAPPSWSEQLALDIIADALTLDAMGENPAALLAATGVRLVLGTTDAPRSARPIAVSPAAAVVFACYAAALADRAGGGSAGQAEQEALDERTAARAARVALQMSPKVAARVEPVVAYVRPLWMASATAASEALRRAFLTAAEDGDVPESLHNRVLHVAYRLVTAGVPLDLLAAELEGSRLAVERYATGAVGRLHGILTGAVDRLRGQPDPAAAVTPASGRATEARTGGAVHVSTATLAVEIATAAIEGDHERAIDAGGALARNPGARNSLLVAVAGFYRALAHATRCDVAVPGDRTEAVAALAAAQAMLAPAGGAGLAAMVLLLSAEQARLSDDPAQAVSAYQQAVEAARERGETGLEALAAERAGLQALSRQDLDGAVAYLRLARSRYDDWRAGAKVAHLDEALDQATTQAPRLLDQLDLLAVVNACRSICAESRLEPLVATVLRLLVEHGRADHGALLLPGQSGLWLAAVADTDHTQVSVVSAPGEPMAEYLPLTVIRSARRSGRPVRETIDSLPAELADDPYLLGHRPHALLCVPIVRDGDIVAVVYLDRRQPAAFEHRAIELLDVLCTQAAIALQNATTQARLMEADRFLDATFNELPAALILLGPELTVRRASPSAEDVTGLPVRPGAPLLDLLDVLAPVDADSTPFRAESGLAALGHGTAPIRRDITIIASTGERRVLSTTTIPVRDEGGVLLGATMMIDRVA
ncbi:AAA family ATPase [Actinoplanes sp. NPDC051513]|uniref:AAA family ATPase n=1 Tax=Actinoplanes sp. NPDC051513 TaxID=3363908 RepID=UPI0037A39829